MPDAPVLLAGRYRLGESLGRGGMGQVRLARDETLERDVAIKEIDQPLGGDGASSARRTLREARAAARISHPNVVQVYDVLQLEDRTWIVMEYVPSRSLREEIAGQGRLDPYRVARIGLDLLAALRTAHRLGVEHRDVKPANVLIADDGRVLLTDFGIAAVDDDGVISRSDILVGSPQFMAPERAQSGVSGREADLWSLGATLYAAVEGHAPYQRGSTMATLAALATEEPDPPKHAGPLRPLLDGLLKKNPARRLTAEDAESLLRAILANLSPESSRGMSPPTRRATARVPRPRIASDQLPVAGAAGEGEPDGGRASGAATGPHREAVPAGGAPSAGQPAAGSGEGGTAGSDGVQVAGEGGVAASDVAHTPAVEAGATAGDAQASEDDAAADREALPEKGAIVAGPGAAVTSGTNEDGRSTDAADVGHEAELDAGGVSGDAAGLGRGAARGVGGGLGDATGWGRGPARDVGGGSGDAADAERGTAPDVGGVSGDAADAGRGAAFDVGGVSGDAADAGRGAALDVGGAPGDAAGVGDAAALEVGSRSMESVGKDARAAETVVGGAAPDGGSDDGSGATETRTRVDGEPVSGASRVGGGMSGGATTFPGTAGNGELATVRTAPGRPRRLILLAAAIVVVLLVGGIWFVTGRGGGTPSADEKETGTTATAGTPEATASRAPESAPATQNAQAPSPSPSPEGDGRPVLPAGWELYTDKTGFSVYVPKGWRRTKEGTIVYFRGDGKVLGIDQTNKPRSNPVADWREQAGNRVSGGDFPGYREVKIAAVDYFRKAADWEFTFNRSGVRQHVNNRGTVVRDDKAYGFYWQTRDDVWDESRKDLQLVFDSFRPAQ
ncbi:serine/threonine-protein kinase [Actinoplanes flavus]|uniref:serine/threonine-protein kinase n=1 Tax=Actinoplanes flavus TaxID=2820290 RepID=UPI001EE5611F|nr:serine/threonine-protein kinase [Actinoplanes flavus]